MSKDNSGITDPTKVETQVSDEKQTDVNQIGSLVLLNDGFNFNFEISDHKIIAWGSAKSGKEKVLVDSKPVSEKRSFTKKSIHTFILDDLPYEIEFQTVSLLTGELHCTLIKDGVHVETQKQVPRYTADKKSAKWRIGLWFIAGFTFGFYAIDKIVPYFFE